MRIYGSYSGSDDYYNHGGEVFNDDMTNPVSNCSRFERRHDFNTFNMANYLSCENCRHLSADNRCIAHQDTHFGRLR